MVTEGACAKEEVQGRRVREYKDKVENRNRECRRERLWKWGVYEWEVEQRVG